MAVSDRTGPLAPTCSSCFTTATFRPRRGKPRKPVPFTAAGAFAAGLMIGRLLGR